MSKKTRYLATSLGLALFGVFFLIDSRFDLTGRAVEANAFLGIGASGLGIIFVLASIVLFVIAWALKE